MKKTQIVDYRGFRFRKLNTPEFSHLKYLLFWPIYRCDFICSTAEFLRSISLCRESHPSHIACHCGRYFGSLYPCPHARHRKKAGTPVSENKKAADRQMDQHHQLCSHPALCCFGAGVGFNIADPGAGSVFSELVCAGGSEPPAMDCVPQPPRYRTG